MATRAKASRTVEPRSFETLFADLEDRARRLEDGNLSLEDSLKLYEEGAGLVAELRALLDVAELRVRTVRGQIDGEEGDLREEPSRYDEVDDLDYEEAE
jgi:exodeoxyribonuclease VII small subunit